MYRRGLLMVLALAGIATFGAGNGSAQDKTIKIGGLFPMSGPGAYFGAHRDHPACRLRSPPTAERS